jgi:metal-responsive CopG/Arc/MetJ family transcriptional regulator
MPRKPKKGRPRGSLERNRVQVTMTLPPDLLSHINKMAKRDERTRSKVFEIILRQHIEATP